MADYLLEIGTEELPASFLRSALASLRELAQEWLRSARLEAEAVQTLGTPRRLGLRISGLPERQADRHEQLVGPPWAAAFDADDQPKKAALGFARKNGVEVGDLLSVETPKGRYVAATLDEPGRPTAEVLAEALPRLCGRIAFPKVMRWGAGEVAFGRPVHWIVSLLDADIVPFEFADTCAGRETRGHRFLAPDRLSLSSAADWQPSLERAHVLVDLADRRARMLERLRAAAEALGGELLEDAFLVGECASLVEEPFVVPGAFDARFLALPEEVVVSVMRDHQRYFAVQDPQTEALLPHYLNVVNTALAPEIIALGNDRVLRARLADARFFVEQDQKESLESRLPKLDSVVFQAKLGSVGDKLRRVARLAEALADDAGCDPEQAARAVGVAKADLETLIVGEFPELQGKMGRFYALAEGLPAEIADVARDHYLPQGPTDDVPTAPLSAVVALADRADTLVGCFGIGQIPTGSADPFALRRAALGVIRVALEGPMDVDLERLLSRARAGYPDAMLAADAGELMEFFRARLRVMLKGQHSADVVEAGLAAWSGGSLRDLVARVAAVAEFRELPDFESLATAFKRAHNITADAERGDVDPALLEEAAERALFEVWQGVRPRLLEAARGGHYGDALALVASELRAPIDAFFDGVYVMADDARVRANRLRLLASIADAVSSISHLHLLAS
ncbi:MAG: glycine--tRNA ligase subunit beta [Deltaproteobacteria bacterium]|nr:glycine--tRNA ligase subunit beta [Deltaproteobacteria bacterium]